MKSILKFFPVILLLVFAFSCTKEEHAKVEIEATLIAQDNLYGNGNEGITQQNLVITDQSSWNDLLAKMNSVNNVTDSFTETEIDFDDYQVIAVFDKIRPTAGYQVDMKITNDDDNIYVDVTESSPQGISLTVITQPYHIVKIPVSDLKVVFE